MIHKFSLGPEEGSWKRVRADENVGGRRSLRIKPYVVHLLKPTLLGSGSQYQEERIYDQFSDLKCSEIGLAIISACVRLHAELNQSRRGRDQVNCLSRQVGVGCSHSTSSHVIRYSNNCTPKRRPDAGRVY